MQLHLRTGREYASVLQPGLDLIKPCGTVRHGTDLIDGAAAGHPFLFNLHLIPLTQVTAYSLCCGERYHPLPLSGDDAYQVALGYGIKYLHVTDFHQTADGRCNLAVFQLGLICKFRLLILDSGAVRLIPVLFVSLDGDTAAVVEDLLPGQFVLGLPQRQGRRIHGTFGRLHLLCVYGAYDLAFRHNVSRLNVDGRHITRSLGINVNHIRGFHLSYEAGGETDITDPGICCLHYREGHCLRKLLVAHKPWKDCRTDYRCHGHSHDNAFFHNISPLLYLNCHPVHNRLHVGHFLVEHPGYLFLFACACHIYLDGHC